MTCAHELVDQFLEPIARTGKSLDQFPTPIARTDMSYVTAIPYPRATLYKGTGHYSFQGLKECANCPDTFSAVPNRYGGFTGGFKRGFKSRMNRVIVSNT